MKIATKLPWVNCLVLLATTSWLASCDTKPQNQEQPPQGATTSTDLGGATTGSQPVPERQPSRPGKPGVLGREENYGNAVQYVKNYRQRVSQNDVRSIYLDTALLFTMLKDRSSAGLRFYLADSAKTGNNRRTHVIVVRVDAQGRDIDLGKKSLSANYLMGISDEKCPHNCGGCTLEQQE